MKKTLLLLILFVSIFIDTNAQVKILESAGWFEAAYVVWEPHAGAESYKVYYTGGGKSDQLIDQQLIRNYGGYFRADVLGLAPGNYTLKVVPVTAGSENAANSVTSATLNVKPHKREGFGFSDGSLPGAYKADGSLKDNAQVLYIDNTTAKTVTLDVIVDKNGKKETFTGISTILSNKGKGYDRTALSVRFIGKVLKENIDVVKDNKYLNLEGNKSLAEAKENDRGPLFNVTIEGVGNDATLYGYGINMKRTAYTEIRNLAFMLWGGGSDGDAVSMDTENQYAWVHHNDFFYGVPGGDADQIKGDGTIDMKANSSNITISFNHFWDSGKVMGVGGATGEINQLLVTFHHNWFDHSDSRMPRLTFANAHIYNNYYDGVSVYGIGTSRFSSALVENNYFRGTYRPILIPGQGTDIWEGASKGFTGSSFTSQEGGMNKAYNNSMNGGNANNNLNYFHQNNTPVEGQIDAYQVTDLSTTLPASVAAVRGGYTYNNFDTASGMYQYTAELPEAARNTVLSQAGRMNGGDYKWTFNNAVEDGNSSVISGLNNALKSYQTYFGNYQSNVTSLKNSVEDISIYPNPATDVLKISTNLAVKSIEVYSTSGQLLLQQKGNTTTIDLKSFINGFYIVKINTDKGSIRKRVVKQ